MKHIKIMVGLILAAHSGGVKSAEYPNQNDISKPIVSRFDNSFIPEKKSGTSIIAGTLNLYCSFLDGRTESPYKWDERKKSVLELIRTTNPDILCFQEASPKQIQDLDGDLSVSGYKIFGHAPHSGHRWQDLKENEYTGAMHGFIYQSKRFNITGDEAGHIFWLKTDPNTPPQADPFKPDPDQEKGFGDNKAAFRAVNYCELEDLVTGDKFTAASTHFSHVGKGERDKSAQLVADWAYPLIQGRQRIILGGDFNMYDEDGDTIHNLLTGKGLRDVRQANIDHHFGQASTFIGLP